MTSQEQLIEFLNAQVKALQKENEQLKKQIAEAREILTEIIIDTENGDDTQPN